MLLTGADSAALFILPGSFILDFFFGVVALRSMVGAVVIISGAADKISH